MMSEPPPVPANNSSELFRDRAFWGMTVTQFLGAFNDNLFKQLVLLICLDVGTADSTGNYYQSIAMALFAIPFVMFSGFAGFLSDRMSKRRTVVLMKVAEIAIMSAGLLVFAFAGGPAGQMAPFLFVVLFGMSTQSAFFGPAKYGILPELFADRDLPLANGIIQMTTFVAIIFGTALAGYGKDWFPERLWIVSLVCIAIAAVGTLTSLLVRRTPIAREGLAFEWSSLGVNFETRSLLFGDGVLLRVLLISSVFWFLGGVMLPATNSFGINDLGLDNSRTSWLSACMGIGIALGCTLAGKLSHEKINFHVVRIGSFGLVATLGGLTLLGGWHEAAPFTGMENACRLVMLLVGFFGGLFIVPLQVFMQARPPKDQKGRMIGAMNLINWIAICLATAFFALATAVFKQFTLGMHWMFGVLAMMILPVAIFYRPPDLALNGQEKTAIS